MIYFRLVRQITNYESVVFGSHLLFIYFIILNININSDHNHYDYRYYLADGCDVKYIGWIVGDFMKVVNHRHL